MHRRRFLLWGRPRAANVSALRQVAVAAYTRTPSALAIELRFVWSVSPADEWLCRAEWARLLQTSEDPPDEGGLAGGVLAPVVSDAGDLTLEGHVFRSERLVTSQRVAERRPPVPFRPSASTRCTTVTRCASTSLESHVWRSPSAVIRVLSSANPPRLRSATAASWAAGLTPTRTSTTSLLSIPRAVEPTCSMALVTPTQLWITAASPLNRAAQLTMSGGINSRR